jgi:hypothetical protein
LNLPLVQAYWLSPDGVAYEVENLHILSIFKQPEVFGSSRSSLQQYFDKHAEPLGFEGFAREEIFHELFCDGWIRIRYVIKTGTWTIQLAEWNEVSHGHILAWVQLMAKSRRCDRSCGVRILLNDGAEFLSEMDIFAQDPQFCVFKKKLNPQKLKMSFLKL